MDWQRWIVLLALVGACGGRGMGKPLPAGQTPSRAAVAMKTTKVLSKNALSYQVAVAAPYLVSVELTTEFELVVRGLPNTPDTPRTSKLKTRRMRLDAATYDINALALDAKEGRAFVASSAGWVRSYDLQSLQMQSEWRMGSGATSLALSDDRQYLLIGTATGVICIRRLADGAQLQCLAAHAGRVSSLAIANGRLASASWQGELSLWGLPALDRVSTLARRGSIADIAFAPDGTRLAVARNQRAPIRTQAIDDAEKKSSNVDPLGLNVIQLYPVTKRGLADAPLHTLVGHHGLVTSLSWIGRDLLSGSWDRTVQLWNSQLGSRTMKLGEFKHIVRDIASSQAQASFAIATWGPERSDPALSWGHLHY